MRGYCFVPKKKPVTLSEFEAFFNLLPQRGDSESSWTIDFTARKVKAAEEAKPFHEQARAKQQEVARWKEHLVELKKAPREQKDINAIDTAENQIKALTKEANTFKAKAVDIENAVYDLKAVNPNKKLIIDARTPDDLLDIIDAKGKEINEVLALLRKH